MNICEREFWSRDCTTSVGQRVLEAVHEHSTPLFQRQLFRNVCSAFKRRKAYYTLMHGASITMMVTHLHVALPVFLAAAARVAQSCTNLLLFFYSMGLCRAFPFLSFTYAFHAFCLYYTMASMSWLLLLAHGWVL